MKIEKHKVVELCYELEVEGNIVDKTTAEKPLDYIHGTRTLLDKFEANLEGKEPGDKFAFTLTPAEGYGEFDPNRVIDLPKEAFEVNGTIQEDLLVPGTTIPLMNSAGGIVPGKVVEVSEKFVIQLRIDNQTYPIKIRRDEEEIYRAAERKINDKLNLYKEHFPNLEEERYMFMAMLDLSVQLIRSEKRNDTEPYEAVLQNITAEIESTLASE